MCMYVLDPCSSDAAVATVAVEGMSAKPNPLLPGSKTTCTAKLRGVAFDFLGTQVLACRTQPPNP